MRDHALETLSDPDAVLVIDETGFLKQGNASSGVGRQYTGSAGKITNCQIGVFAAYVSQHGHAFIDRALYLPKAWTGDPTRMSKAYVPEGTGFATKPHLAAGMAERAIAAGVPFAWVAADSVYGVGEVEAALRRANKGYVLGVNATHQFHSWSAKLAVSGSAEEIAKELDASAWQRLSAGLGTKGPRLCDWAYLELADLDAARFCPGSSGLWTRGLLAHRTRIARRFRPHPAGLAPLIPQQTVKEQTGRRRHTVLREQGPYPSLHIPQRCRPQPQRRLNRCTRHP